MLIDQLMDQCQRNFNFLPFKHQVSIRTVHVFAKVQRL